MKNREAALWAELLAARELLDATYSSSSDSGIALTARVTLSEWFRQRDRCLAVIDSFREEQQARDRESTRPGNGHASKW